MAYTIRRAEYFYAAVEDHPGEAYELLFTAKHRTRVPAHIVGIPVTCIGEIMRRKNLTLVRTNLTRTTLAVRGWQHFQQPTPDK